MDQGLWSFINTRTCRRKAILDHYQDIDRAKDNLASGPCCDIHTGDDITKYPCGKGCPAFSEVQAVNYDAPSMPRPPATSQHLQEQVLEYLIDWRNKVYDRDCPMKEHLGVSWIISDKNLQTVARSAARITDVQTLLSVPEFCWSKIRIEQYGAALVGEVVQAIIAIGTHTHDRPSQRRSVTPPPRVITAKVTKDANCTPFTKIIKDTGVPVVPGIS
jgi:hypothetical protein